MSNERCEKTRAPRITPLPAKPSGLELMSYLGLPLPTTEEIEEHERAKAAREKEQD